MTLNEESRKAGISPSNFTRGRFLSLGLTMGAGAAFVACSGQQETAAPESSAASGSSSNEPSSAETTQEAASSSSSGAESIVATSEVPVGESFEFEADGEPAVLVHRAQDEFVAYSAVCTHQGCEVAYQDEGLVCPCHGSVFDLQDGAPTTGPANTPLPSIAVAVQGGEVVRA